MTALVFLISTFRLFDFSTFAPPASGQTWWSGNREVVATMAPGSLTALSADEMRLMARVQAAIMPEDGDVSIGWRRADGSVVELCVACDGELHLWIGEETSSMGHLAACLSGPAASGVATCAEWFDSDRDRDVDLRDVCELQRRAR